jgi:hypothetical protein
MYYEEVKREKIEREKQVEEVQEFFFSLLS